MRWDDTSLHPPTPQKWSQMSPVWVMQSCAGKLFGDSSNQMTDSNEGRGLWSMLCSLLRCLGKPLKGQNDKFCHSKSKESGYNTNPLQTSHISPLQCWHSVILQRANRFLLTDVKGDAVFVQMFHINSENRVILQMQITSSAIYFNSVSVELSVSLVCSFWQGVIEGHPHCNMLHITRILYIRAVKLD